MLSHNENLQLEVTLSFVVFQRGCLRALLPCMTGDLTSVDMLEELLPVKIIS